MSRMKKKRKKKRKKKAAIVEFLNRVPLQSQLVYS